MRPDYTGGGFLNLLASLAAACGARPRHPPLRALLPTELAAASNLVLLIVDGLGDRYLRARGAGGQLERHRRSAISAVFPSTTAAAITTSYTGWAPLEHGLTGWFTYFAEAGCVAAPLTGRSRGDDLPLSTRGVASARLFAAPSLFDTLTRRTIVVSEANIVGSAYNVHHCGRAERRAYVDRAGLLAQIEAAVTSGADRKFVYAYWPYFDTLAHRYGIASAEVRAELTAIDSAFSELLERLTGSDALVIVTADHGFIDSRPGEALALEDGPGLASLLRLPLCGERRVAFCHVQNGLVATFAASAKEWLGDRAEVRSSRELAEEGWFGTGTAHPRFAERIGDVALVMNKHYTVKDWVPGETRNLIVGHHGGTSEDEMLIPLVIAKV